MNTLSNANASLVVQGSLEEQLALLDRHPYDYRLFTGHQVVERENGGDSKLLDAIISSMAAKSKTSETVNS